MRTRLTRVLLVLVTTAFCTIAFASSLTDAGQDSAVQGAGAPAQAGTPAWFDVVGSTGLLTPEPLLLAKEGKDDDRDDSDGRDDRGDRDDRNGYGQDKVYVCHVLPNGKFITQKLPKKTALKLIEEHPHEWILGKCDDVISPS